MMKPLTLLTLAAIVLSLAAPRAAQADDKTRALVGGLIGGIIIGSILDDDDDRYHRTEVHVSHRQHARHHRYESRPRGYWEWVRVKHWNRGYYERSCDRYGRTVKIWVPGHYTYSKKKVWVEERRRPSYRSSRRYESRPERYHRHDANCDHGRSCDSGERRSRYDRYERDRDRSQRARY